ncbi:MAG: ABC transporter permease subunit [Anaerolineae bacterium]|nr:ABC transporter permease subunit [Anaerolineae bacterium]
MAILPSTRNKPISPQFSRWHLAGLRWLLTPLLGIGLWLLWTWAAESERYPAFILPHPEAVLLRLQTLHERDLLMGHIWATLRQALTGLALAVCLALPLGYAVARNRWVSALLLPYLVAIRAIPVVAIAAIVVIWLGTGIESKVFVVTFITWFPLMEATVVGIQSVDPTCAT